MLISKFDLCKTEWLDLVFAKRNQEYGAYYIRQHYAGNIVKAMGITFFTISCSAIIMGAVIKTKPQAIVKRTEVVLNTYHPPVVPPKAELKKPKPAASKPTPPVTTHKYVQMVVTSEPVKEEPPKVDDLKDAPVGPVEVKVAGSGTAINVIDNGIKDGEGTGNKPGNDMKVYTPNGLDVMPEPYGGAAGWNKFLQKNMRYPSEALDKNMTGKVMISFVIEKDGHLSSLTVDRGAGFGMDEEALRVLKLSKAWKPGMQNGQPVRVRYSIPINFSLAQ